MTSPNHHSVRLLGISGSLRAASFNTALLRLAQRLLPEGSTLEMADLHDIPLYDLDVEQAVGFPAPVVRLREQMAGADGIVIATPEYNFSVPGVLKNAIDWASRHGDSPLNHKATAVGGVAGGSGSRQAQEHLRAVLGHNRVRVMARPELLVPRGSRFFVEGEAVDDAFISDVNDWLAAFLQFVAWSRTAPPVEPGTVLVVAPEHDVVRLAKDQLAEYGIRSIATTSGTVAAAAIEHRGIAALVVSDTLDAAERRTLDGALARWRPGAPTVDFADATLAGHAVVKAVTTF